MALARRLNGEGDTFSDFSFAEKIASAAVPKLQGSARWPHYYPDEILTIYVTTTNTQITICIIVCVVSIIRADFIVRVSYICRVV